MALVLTLAIGGLSLLVGLYYWIKVDQIECQTQRGRCSVEMVAWLNGFKGVPTPLAMHRISTTMSQEFGFVQSLSSSLTGLTSLRVETILDTPALTVTSTELMSGGTYYTVTFEGVLMEKTTMASEPVLLVDNLGTVVGKKLEDTNVKAVQIAYHMASLGYKFQSRVSGSNFYVVTNNQQAAKSAWFNLEDSRTAAQLVSAFQVIARQNSLANKPITIDMRYDRPVIRELESAVAGDSDVNE